MIISYDCEWIPISEEEYEKHSYKRKNNSLMELLTECYDIYKKQPIYGGIQNVIDNKPIGYKYYKKGDYKSFIICSEQQFNRMTLKICKKCNKVVEMIKTKNCDFGYDTTTYKCPECGYIETEQINRVHYGNDEYRRN